MEAGWRSPEQAAQCEATDPSGRRCALVSGHAGEHVAGAASASEAPIGAEPTAAVPSGSPADKPKSSGSGCLGAIILIAIIGAGWWFISGGGDRGGTSTPPVVTVTAEPNSRPATGTVAQQNAIRAAQDYLDYTAFSRSGLIDQLVFEGYSQSDAAYAVDWLDVNWNEQAARSAKAYLDYSSFSRQGLIDQLEFEGYTHAQAVYGVDQTGL